MAIYFYEFDIGKICIAEKDERITNLYFESDKIPQYNFVKTLDLDITLGDNISI